jgi:tyrosyl-tRNA synthetase
MLLVFYQIGGATGSIGDPSGRSSERNALSREELDHNVKAIHNQVRIFFDRGLAYAKRRIPDNGAVLGEKRILNNLDWTQEVTLLDFLRGVGKHSRVNTMLARDR